MTILLLTAWYPNRRARWSGSFIAEQAKALRRKHRVIVLALTSEPSPFFLAEGEEDFHVVRMPRRRIVAALYALPRIVATIRMIQQTTRIDLIHAHVSFPTGVLAVSAGKRFRLPVVVTEHFGPFRKLVRNFFVRSLVRRSLRRTDAVIAVSHSLKKEMESAIGPLSKITVIPNTVDTDRFSLRPRRRERGVVRFLFIAPLTRTNHLKGFDLLLEALATARRDFRTQSIDLRLDVVGGGEFTEFFRARATELEIDSACRFLGVIEHSDLPEVIRACDALVLPSRAETFGVVLIEAMACGLPVLATRSGGPEDIVTPETGILVDPNSVEALASGLQTLVSRLDTFVPATIAESAKRRFALPVVSARIETVYSALVQTT